MPKSSANIPSVEPSVDRLSLTSEWARSGSDTVSNWPPGTNWIANCFESGPSLLCGFTNCFEESI